MPSTYADTVPLWFSCTITDTAGGKVTTRQARRTIKNPRAEMALVYVGDQVLKPGESLNLADVNYGTGTVSFSDDGTNMTLDNVVMNNPTMVSDWKLSYAQGILLVDNRFYVDPYAPYDPSKYEDLPEEYHITVNGENAFVSKHFDSVGSGVVLQAYFATKNNPDYMPRVYMEGDGRLDIDGGSFNFTTDARLNLGVDINGKSNDLTIVGDAFGVQGTDIIMEGTRNYNFDVRNAALNAYSEGNNKGDLVISDGTTINVTSNPGIGGPMTGNSILSSSDRLITTNATINLNGTVFADRFTPISNHKLYRFVGIMGSEGVTIDNCDVNINMAVEDHPQGRYVANVAGLASNSNHTLLLTNGSKVNVELDSPEAYNAFGINTGGNVVIEKDSSFAAAVSGMGNNVYGIHTLDSLDVVDSNVDVDVEGAPYTDPDSGVVYDNTVGIFGRPVSIDFTDDTHHVYTKTNRGAAFMAADTDASPLDTDIPSFDPAYVSKFTNLKNKATIVLPEESAISGYGFVYSDSQVQLGDTVYNLANTSAPAKEVLIAAAKSDTPSVPNSGAESKKNDSSVVETSLSIIVTTAALSVISLYFYRSKKTRE